MCIILVISTLCQVDVHLINYLQFTGLEYICCHCFPRPQHSNRRGWPWLLGDMQEALWVCIYVFIFLYFISKTLREKKLCHFPPPQKLCRPIGYSTPLLSRENACVKLPVGCHHFVFSLHQLLDTGHSHSILVGYPGALQHNLSPSAPVAFCLDTRSPYRLLFITHFLTMGSV